MKWLSALKAWARPRQQDAPPASAPAVDLVDARIIALLKAAGAQTQAEIVAELRKRHACFVHSNDDGALYQFGMAGGAADYHPSCDLALKAAVLCYPTPNIKSALLLKN